MDPKKPTWVRAGGHTVVVVIDGDTQTKIIDVRADQIEAVVATRPVPAAGGAAPAPATTTPTSTPPPPSGATTEPSPPPAPDDRTPSEKSASKKLPPAVFWVSLGVTGASAVISTIFMASAAGAHGDFVDAGCERANELPCAGFKEAGESSQSRANVSIVVTAVLAAATVVIGTVLTDWSGRKTTAKSSGIVVTGSGFRF
jgi:hypothetical protein